LWEIHPLGHGAASFGLPTAHADLSSIESARAFDEQMAQPGK
jgi:hypothetical protein